MAASSTWCVFVLLLIQSAELLPTTKSYDDHPAGEVNDYRLSNGYTNQKQIHTTQITMEMSRSTKRNSSQLISKENEGMNKLNIETKFNIKNAEVFLKKRMKRRLKLEMSATNKLLDPTNSPDTTDIYLASNNRREKTYRWMLLPSDSNNPFNPFLAEYVEFGLNQWARVSKVNFKYVPYREDMDMSEFDILIKFERGAHGDDKPFDGPGGMLGHVIPPDPDDPEEKIEIHLDGEENWKFGKGDYKKERPDETPDFIEEVMHEAGHALLFGRSQNPNSVMHHPLRKKQDQIKDGRPYPFYFLSREDKQNVKANQGRCSPPKIDAIFSYFRGDGQSYIFVGPYTYKIDQKSGSTIATISESFPRPSILYWNNFEFVDEAFIHADQNTYFFSGDEYAVHLTTQLGRKMLYKRKIGRGNDGQSTYVGWPGLKHHRYIDAALLLFEEDVYKSYIFQDDLVYLWDSNKKIQENDEYHHPKGGVASGWPKKISEIFPGIPNNIDTAFRYYFDGYIYFFKDQFYYRWIPDGNGSGTVKRKRFDNKFRNICNVYMCLPERKKDKPCRSWSMPRDK